MGHRSSNGSRRDGQNRETTRSGNGGDNCREKQDGKQD